MMPQRITHRSEQQSVIISICRRIQMVWSQLTQNQTNDDLLMYNMCMDGADDEHLAWPSCTLVGTVKSLALW